MYQPGRGRRRGEKLLETIYIISQTSSQHQVQRGLSVSVRELQLLPVTWR